MNLASTTTNSAIRMTVIVPFFTLLLVTPTLQAHPGNLDRNGGHYYGSASYHCHISNCEMPDTFSRFGTDSLLINRRDREKFFNQDDWNFELDGDGDCQSTRQEMLILTSRSEIRYTNPRNCVVRTGEWFDEYTGETFNVAVKIDVDHIIPLMYAHTHGGDRWPPSRKLEFANDPLNIMLVEKREIRRKSDRGPSRYMPREEFQCSYVRLWNALADKYNLTIGTRDRNMISRVLRDCPEA